jgi:hypothetical protein
LAWYISYENLDFSVSLIKLKFKLIFSFLPKRKFCVSVEDEMSTPRKMQTGVPQGFVLSPILFNKYINYTTQAIGVHLALFADDTCLHATEHREAYVQRKLQRRLYSMAEWSEL